MTQTTKLAAVLTLSLLLASCSKDVVDGLSQRDVLDAQLILERAGIEVSISKDKEGRFSIATPSGDRNRALELLADQGLPRNAHASLAEVFPGGGFLVTPFEQKARLTYAIEQQLSATLSSLEGVAEARVHVVTPEDNGRGLIREQARASILLRYRPGADISGLETKSRALVVNSVRGLSFEDVSVVASPWHVGPFVPPSPPDTEAAVPAPSAWGTLTGGWGLRGMLLTFAILLAAVAAGILMLPQRRES